MAEKLKPGDKVIWNTPQGKTQGAVERKVTTKTRIKSHIAVPTPEKPEYVVKSDKSGKLAIHRPEGLKRVKT